MVLEMGKVKRTKKLKIRIGKPSARQPGAGVNFLGLGFGWYQVGVSV